MEQKRQLKETVIDLIDSVISEFRFIESEVKSFDLQPVLKEKVLLACQSIAEDMANEIQNDRNILIGLFDNSRTNDNSAWNEIFDVFQKLNKGLRDNFEKLAVFTNEGAETEDERTLNMLLYSIGGDILRYVAGLNYILDELRKTVTGGFK